MKILCTSDIHIFDYNTYAIFDENGVPDRLKQFDLLSQDISKLAINKNVDIIVVAGDLFHSSVVQPMVLNYGKKFIETLLSSSKKIIVTHGQHDLSTKSLVNSPIHSIISGVSSDSKNLIYAYEPTTVEINNSKIFIHPWCDDVSKIELKDADIFVGHGIVDGSTTPDGYQFIGGFNPQNLYNRYRLSIIGDIHNGKVFDGGVRNKVLVPGSPIQTTFKDQENCGVWIADITEDNTTLEFISIYSLRDDGTYHKFLTVEDEVNANISKPHIHYRIRKSVSSSNKSSSNNNISSYVIKDKTILDIALEEVNNIKPENIDIFKEILSTAYESVKNKSAIRLPSRIITQAIKIKNFLSIDKLELPIHNNGDTLIYGENGSGKTSVAEAILYAYTGKTTKPISVYNLKNKYLKDDPEIELYFSVNDDIWKIHRGRANGGFVNLYKLPDETSPFNKSSQKDTQEFIYQLLGLTYEDIMVMSYFSTRSLTTFSNITDANKNSLTGRLVNSDEIEILRNKVSELNQGYKSEISKYEGAILAYNSQELQINNTLKQYENKSKSNEIDYSSIYRSLDNLGIPHNRNIDECTKLINVSILDIEAFIESSSNNQETYNTLSRDISKSENIINNLTHSNDKISRDMILVLDKAKKASEGICPMCSQKLHDDKIITNLSKEYSELESQIEANKAQIEDTKSQLKSQKNKLEDISSEIKSYNESKDLLKSLEKLSKEIIILTKPKEDYSQAIELVKSQLADIASEKDNKNNKISNLSKYKLASEVLYKNILSKTGPVIRRYNDLLCVMISNEINNLIIDKSLIDARVSSDKSVNIEVKFKGRDWVSVDEMSGGEGRITDILIMIAINNLFSKKYGLEDGILGVSIFDEVFSHLDDKYGDVAMHALNNSVCKDKLVITHDARLQSNFSRVLKVTNINGISEYKVLS